MKNEHHFVLSEALGRVEGSPEVRSDAEKHDTPPTLWGPFDSLVGLARSG